MDFEYLDRHPLLVERSQQQQFSKMKLFDLVAQRMWANKLLFCQLAERTGKNPFKRLPNTVRAKLIEMGTFFLGDEQANVNCRFLMMLMNEEVSSLSFSSLPQPHNHAMKSVTDTWFALTQKCPRLQKLVCHNFCARKSYGLLVFFSFSLHFAHLQVLDMQNIECNNLRLGLLSQYLTLLRVLQITLKWSVTSKGIASLATLEHLQEFLYYEKILWNRPVNKNHIYFTMCMQLMPNLRVSCSRVEIELELDIFLTDFASKAFHAVRGPLPRTLGLRQLALHSSSEMPRGVALPDLTTLNLILPKSNFQFSTWLSSLTELGLHGLRQHLLERILQQIGHQLIKLTVVVWDSLVLDRLFQLCPSLQIFYISQFPTIYIGLEEPMMEAVNLTGLTELGMVMQDEMDESCRFESGHLLQFLSVACNLRVLHLKNFLFGVEEDKDIGEALEQHSILQNLQQLSSVYERTDPELDAETLECLECSYSVLRNIIQHCPQLSSVTLDA